MNIVRPVALAAALLLLSGCAVVQQAPIPMAQQVVGAPAKIGVGMTALPKVDTFFPGAGCLLCMATAAAANGDLTKHTQTLTHEDLAQLKDKAVAALTQSGLQAQVIAAPLDFKKLAGNSSKAPNAAPKNYAALRTQLGVDKLLVIEITMLGMERMYSAYIPTGDPKAVFRGSAYLVNLENNTYEWYQPITLLRSADGAWDEPPAFPGLTNAYYQVLELGKDAVLKPLATATQAPAAAPAAAAPAAVPAAAAPTK